MALRGSALVLSASVLAAALALTGCTPAEPTPTDTASVAPEPTETESATPTPTETSTDTPETSIPVGLPCTAIISLQAMYDFNPNFSLLSGWTPTAGTAAAEATAAEGVACRWQNDTSGDTIDLSIASFDAASIDRRANAVDSSTAVDTFSTTGFFRVTSGEGEATVFDGAYWVVLRSNYFLEPGDAAQLMSTVLAALP